MQYKDTPTPSIIFDAFLALSKSNHRAHRLLPPDVKSRKDPRSRGLFVNAQWALGGAGTGAPVHYHNTAWNMLAYGAKKWYLYSPRDAIMSNRQIMDFVETDLVHFSSRGKVKEEGRDEDRQRKAEGGGGYQYMNLNTIHRNYSVAPMTCVQTAGDVIIVPESWGHGVLNIQDSVAVATESKSAMWRPLGYDVARFIPGDFDNRRRADSSSSAVSREL